MTDELAALLVAGERAAFHGRPAGGVEPLERAAALAAERGLATERAAALWLLAVCQSAAGCFGRAIAALDGLLPVSAGEPAERLVFGALAEATLASVHRQLGRHDEARAHDEVALAHSTGSAEAAFDARLGLAADSVGLGDADLAREHLAGAADLVGEHTEWWRQRVRMGWVEAEIALLVEDPVTAATAAASAVDLAEHSGAPRHVAKGLLFHGVAQVEQGRHVEAAATLRRAALLAESLGTLPLLWPARALLGALVGETNAAESSRCLDAARHAVTTIGDDLPPQLRQVWLSRADIEALLA